MGNINLRDYGRAVPGRSWTQAQPLYVGTESQGVWRSYISFTTPAPISSSKKLVITANLTDLSSPKGMIAVLSNTAYQPSDLYNPDTAGPLISGLATSLALTSDGGSQAGENIGERNNIYFTFNYTNFQPHTTYYVYFIKYWNNGYYGTGWNQFNISDINLTYTGYTRCGAPTSVTASGIITPNGKFAVSWSGASAGSGNAIKGYRIYWNVSSNGAVPTTSSGSKYISSTSTSGSTTITVSNATRGYKIVCGVRTEGSAGSDYYSGLTTGGLVTINSLPNAPSVSSSKSIIPSTGGEVSFTVTAGNDVNTSQSKTLYYATSASGTKTLFTSPLKIKLTQTSTYYFWTHDGLEFSSSYTSKTITKNTKPTVSISLDTSNTLSSDKAVSGYPYIAAPKISAINGNNGQKVNIHTYTLYSGDTPTTLTKTKEYTNGADVRELIGYSGTIKYYRIGVIRNDGIENSTEVFTPICHIPTAPEITAIYNQYNSSNIKNLEGYFSKKLRLYFSKDSGYSGITLQYKNSSESSFYLDTSLKKNITGSTNYVDFDLSNINLLPGVKYDFALNFYTINLSVSSSTYKNNLIKIKEATIKNLSWNGTINPFEAGQQNIAFTNFFNTTSPSDDDQKSFGYTNSPIYKLVATYGGISATKTNLSASYTLQATAYITLTGQEIYDWLDNLNIPKTIKKTFSLTLSTTNDFGDTSSAKLEKDIDYSGIDAILVGTPSLNFKDSKSSKAIELRTDYFKENMWPHLTLSCKSYYGAPTSITVIGQNGGKVFFSYSGAPSWTSSGTLGNNKPITYSLSNFSLGKIEQQVADLTSASFFSYAITFNGGKTLLDAFTYTSQVGKHLNGQIVINNALYNKGNLSIDFKIEDFGVTNITDNDKQYRVRLQHKQPGGSWNTNGVYFNLEDSTVTDSVYNNKNFDKDTFKLTFSTGIFESGKNEVDYVTIQLIFATEFFIEDVNGNSNGRTYYKAYSQEFVVYNTAPTVAYRKNKIGINYGFSGEDPEITKEVFVVKEHSGASRVYFVGAQRKGHIDLATGEITGFVISCGSWD